jgi:hypothetical protein
MEVKTCKDKYILSVNIWYIVEQSEQTVARESQSFLQRCSHINNNMISY